MKGRNTLGPGKLTTPIMIKNSNHTSRSVMPTSETRKVMGEIIV